MSPSEPPLFPLLLTVHDTDDPFLRSKGSDRWVHVFCPRKMHGQHTCTHWPVHSQCENTAQHHYTTLAGLRLATSCSAGTQSKIGRAWAARAQGWDEVRQLQPAQGAIEQRAGAEQKGEDAVQLRPDGHRVGPAVMAHRAAGKLICSHPCGLFLGTRATLAASWSCLRALHATLCRRGASAGRCDTQ